MSYKITVPDQFDTIPRSLQTFLCGLAFFGFGLTFLTLGIITLVMTPFVLVSECIRGTWSVLTRMFDTRHRSVFSNPKTEA